MLVLRALGGLFLLAALAVLAADLWQGRGLQPTALGELWYGLSPFTLDLSRAVVERYILAELWDPVIVSILLLPAVTVLAGKGALLLILGSLGRRRDPRPRRKPG